MSPFGVRGVPLWGKGFYFFLRVVERHTVPPVEVARRGNVGPLGIIRRAFGDPPVCRDALAVNAQAWAGRHDDEAVVRQLTVPPLHRSCRFRPEIIRRVAIGSKNFSVVQILISQVASENDVQAARAERQLLPGWRRQGRADQRHERRQMALPTALLAHCALTNVRGRKRPISIGTPPELIAGVQARSNTSTARTSAGAKIRLFDRIFALCRALILLFFLAFRGRSGIPTQESLTNAPTTVLAISTSSRADLRPASRRVYDRASADFARDVSSAGWSAIRTVVVVPSDC